MRRYETIAIINPDISDEDRSSLLERIKEIITQEDGVLIDEDLWGNKKMAYEIKKKSRGFYARYDYCGMGPLVDELERSFRIDDRVLKYLTVQLDADADVEKIQAEFASAQDAKKEATQPVDEETETAEKTETAVSDASPDSDVDAADSEPVEANAETAKEE